MTSIVATDQIAERTSSVDTKLDAYAPQARAALRIVAALIYLQAGIQILFSFPVANPPTPPGLEGLVFVAGLMEVIGGGLLIAGLFTRPVAFLLSGQMAVGYWMFHAPMSFFPSQNMGAAAILFCFIYLYLVFAGPGAWALDNRRA